MLIIQGLIIVTIASIVIMYACNSFEEAADYLGRNMSAGTKGATINAIGSSLPELFTTTFLLFLYNDYDGFSAGIATCAGSAVFNAVIIPALSIFAVLFIGIKKNGTREKIKNITISKDIAIRDGIFFLAAEIILILFLSNSTLSWWMGGILIGLYLIYFKILSKGFNSSTEEEIEEEDNSERISKLKALITLNFNQLFFNGKSLNNRRAWFVLSLAIIFIAGSCYYLAESVFILAKGIGISPFVSAVIFAAAATSVPDTILSVKDALKGNYDDAVSNAVGSNIFDITICLGLPLFLYGIINGNINLSSTINGTAEVQTLRIGLLITSSIVLALFTIGENLGKVKAISLIGIYIGWLIFILNL